MAEDLVKQLKIDKTAFRVFNSFEELEEAELEYVLSQTPEERVARVELLRQLNYGEQARGRLQRVLTVTPMSQG